MIAGSEPVWVPQAAVRIIHDRQIARHGGLPGLRDPALLQAGCDRARNKWAFADPDDRPDLAILAAGYAFGIAKAHAFGDANKRTAFQTCFVFLYLNGVDLHLDQADVVANMNALAAGSLDETAFANWLRGGCRALAAQPGHLARTPK